MYQGGYSSFPVNLWYLSSILSFCFLIKSAWICLFYRIRVIFLEITDSCCCRSSKETDVLTSCIVSSIIFTYLHSLWYSMMHFPQQGQSCDLQNIWYFSLCFAQNSLISKIKIGSFLYSSIGTVTWCMVDLEAPWCSLQPKNIPTSHSEYQVSETFEMMRVKLTQGRI